MDGFLNKKIKIDERKLITAQNTLFDGLGFISANNSSRLLLDYRQEQPEAYREILEYIFGEKGLNMSLFKLEMGADVNSSSGTEPAVKRSAAEKADVTRGAGFILAADAQKINPGLEIDMLYWGIPNWVASSENFYAAMYKWYKETLDAMYGEYGLKASYVTVTQNEREIDVGLIKYISAALKKETDAPYDYGAIKIVAGEGVGTWEIADAMLSDAELMEAVDVVSSHYTSFTTENVKLLQQKYGKKVWFSEGSSPMKSAELAKNREGISGIGGLNGTLDIATRITKAFEQGMTMYEFQPAVEAYYDGATFSSKRLIKANEPWSGAYVIDSGYFMALHFARFIKRGWQRIDGACFGDGEPGGDGHAIVNSTYNYAAFAALDRSAFSAVIVNNSARKLWYTVEVSGFENAPEKLNLWETKSGAYFVKKSVLRPMSAAPAVDCEPAALAAADRLYELELLPYSMVTLTTVEAEECAYPDRSDCGRLLLLPYADDFAYADYGADYLAKRGMAPRYTTDEGGAFEICLSEGCGILTQQINYGNKAVEWGATPNPVTTLGDDRWSDCFARIDACFAPNDGKSRTQPNYVGIGARYILADNVESGYWFKLAYDGSCFIMKNKTVLAEKSIADFDARTWHTLEISVSGRKISAELDEKEVLSVYDNACLIHSGRAAIYSDYENNRFARLFVGTKSADYAVARVDDMDCAVKMYPNAGEADGWNFETAGSFRNFNRTVSTGTAGCFLEFEFEGTRIALVGASKDLAVCAEIDGRIIDEYLKCPDSEERACPFVFDGLKKGRHSLKITILSGTLLFDAFEYL